jgi:hypothetical protein
MHSLERSLTANLLITAFALLLVSLPVEAKEVSYGATFAAHFSPADGVVEATLRIDQNDGQLRALDLNINDNHTAFDGDGELETQAGRVLWSVPRKGGALTYRVRVDSRRGATFDARLTNRWAVLRLDDLFPSARVRAIRGARSRSTLSLSGPPHWSFATRYGREHVDLAVTNPKRRFVRPTGWMAAGELGIRRDLIAERDVAVAAPRGQNVRRIDVLAFLRWTLPALTEVFPSFPDQLLIVGAGEEMWRGGLSGPGSLYLHPGRPLISENGTSTLLHELAHVAIATPPASGDDWIVEGLAEYYSIEILRRTDGISQERFTQTLGWLQAWADREGGRLSDPSTGPHSARAALLFHALARELANSDSTLDTVVQQLLATGKITRGGLKSAAETQLGGPSKALSELP